MARSHAMSEIYLRQTPPLEKSNQAMKTADTMHRTRKLLNMTASFLVVFPFARANAPGRKMVPKRMNGMLKSPVDGSMFLYTS